MKAKPETEIRNLKKRVKDLELICECVGVPLILIEMPELIFNSKQYKNWDKKNDLRFKISD